MKKIITYGTFDMLHIGHINILTRAKARGDYLIVGVTSDDYDRSRGKLNVIQSQEQRVKAIEELDVVDEVILETHKTQKQEDMVKYGIDEFVIGDDWVGYFDYLNEFTKVVYLPRTKGISSTKIRNESISDIKFGVVNVEHHSKRFVKELACVNFTKVNSVYDKNVASVYSELNLPTKAHKFDDYDEFLASDIDVVYICGDISSRYNLVKKALLSGKNVLCENPISIKEGEAEELFSIAKKQKKLLLLALKTAFAPAFNKLLEQINQGVIG
ncbi:MAG: adenylyltransferase/cytidyltransferase family protein, partial [Flavobacteriaceae bacterium]|nr:adenylyltransferase/cytidyltransferase family protein [Flavobacteriaceae bacterium]